MSGKSQLWIGLAEVLVRAGNKVLPAHIMGASVNVIAFAASRYDFRRQLLEALRGAGLDLVSLEDVEPFSRRTKKYRVSPRLHRLAERVKADRKVGFGTFHTFPRALTPSFVCIPS